MKHDIFIFLDYWDNPNPTAHDQLSFKVAEMVNETEAEEIGVVFANGYFVGKDKFCAMLDLIIGKHPSWVIGLEKSATELLKMGGQKRILINPAISKDILALNKRYDSDNIYAFFSTDHEEDYNNYCTALDNVAFYPLKKTLFIDDVKDCILDIINGDQI